MFNSFFGPFGGPSFGGPCCKCGHCCWCNRNNALFGLAWLAIECNCGRRFDRKRFPGGPGCFPGGGFLGGEIREEIREERRLEDVRFRGCDYSSFFRPRRWWW